MLSSFAYKLDEFIVYSLTTTVRESKKTAFSNSPKPAYNIKLVILIVQNPTSEN